MYSDLYTITNFDTSIGFATIPIPTSYQGITQNRTLSPGAYYIAVECYNNNGANDIVIYDDNTITREPWSSMIYISDYYYNQWFTNGNAFSIFS